MKCPFCGADDTRVIDSRPADDNTSIRRRRQCDVCQKRFTTYEKVEEIPLMVIKKDLQRQPYERKKEYEEEADIFAKEKKEIASSYIGELVMNELKNLDAVAYVRFASIYRQFKDVDTFMEEIKKIIDKQ